MRKRLSIQSDKARWGLFDLFARDNNAKTSCRKMIDLMAAPSDHKIKIQYRELDISIVERSL